MREEQSNKEGQQPSVQDLKLTLRKKLVDLFHHKGTPLEDKEKLKNIIDKMVK